MKSLIQYDEFGHGMGFQSMRESFASEPYEGIDKIVSYLSKGRKTYASPSRYKDAFTGELIPGERCGMTDGEYSWNGALVYYVKKYNLRLSQEFERKILGQQNDIKI